MLVELKQVVYNQFDGSYKVDTLVVNPAQISSFEPQENEFLAERMKSRLQLDTEYTTLYIGNKAYTIIGSVEYVAEKLGSQTTIKSRKRILNG